MKPTRVSELNTANILMSAHCTQYYRAVINKDMCENVRK